MLALIFKNDDGISRVLPVFSPDRASAISDCDDIIRKFVAEHPALADVDVDFEANDPGSLLPGDMVASWAIGAEGEYFELWHMSTPEDL